MTTRSSSTEHPSPPPQDKELKQHFESAPPPDGKTDALGHPTYLGCSGDKLTWAITVAACCGFGLFGYDQGVMSGIIGAEQFFRTFLDLDPERVGSAHASLMQATYVAIYEVGCLAGAVFAFCYGDRLGRRKMMFWGAGVMMIGVLIQITCFEGHSPGAQFIIGRIVTGVGNGMNTSTIPTWHAECSKSHNRGLMVCIEASMIAAGTMISYWVNLGFNLLDNSLSWRLPILLQVVFAIGLVGMTIWLPESPRWLISAGHIQEGQRVVAALEPCAFNDHAAVLATRNILDSIKGQPKRQKKDVLTSGPTQHLRRVLIGCSSQIMQQLGGCNAIIYFSSPIYRTYLGFSVRMSLVLGSVNMTVYFLATFVCLYLIERLGRRKLFLIGTVGQALSMLLVMAGLAATANGAINASVVGMFTYLIFFGFSWLQLPWLYPAEINPLATRTNANALSTCMNWLFNYAIVNITPVLLNATAWGTFLFFGALNVTFLPVIYLFYPETAGRSLEEIDIIFATAYVEKRSYVETSLNMPRLDGNDIEQAAKRLGLEAVGEDKKLSEKLASGQNRTDRRVDDDEATVGGF